MFGKLKHFSGQEERNSSQAEKKKKEKDPKKASKQKKKTESLTSGSQLDPEVVSDSNQCSPSCSHSHDSPWICVTCKVWSKDDNSKMMECEKCAKHFCLECIDMSDVVYEFMSREEVFWCCEVCVTPVRAMVGSESRESNKKMREDLDETMRDMKYLVGQFRSLVQGGGETQSNTPINNQNDDDKVGEQAEETSVKERAHPNTAQENKNPWKQAPVTKSFKDILREASEDALREAEEERQRSMTS